MKQYAALDDTIYLWFASNDTSGSGGDGASAAADVRLAGAAAGAAPVYSPTPTLLSHANYPAGSYEIAIAATAANGFATGNTYATFCTLAIDSQNPTGFVGSFDLKPVESDLIYIHGTALTETDGQLAAAFKKLFDVATPLLVASDVMVGTDSAALAATALSDVTWTDVRAGYLDNLSAGAVALNAGVDVIKWRGSTVLTPSGGRPKVDTDSLMGYTTGANYLNDLVMNGYDHTNKKIEGCKVNDDMRGTDSAALAIDANPEMLLDTTVSLVASQTEFRLTSGLGRTDSYKDQIVVLYDVSQSNDPSVRICTSYNDALQQITLDSAPDFTVVNGDTVKIFAANTSAVPTVTEIRTEMEGAGTKLTNVLEDVTGLDGDVMRGTDSAALAANENADLILDTTVTSVVTQTDFQLVGSPSDDMDSYVDHAILLVDASATSTTFLRRCTAYNGATHRLQIDSAPGFTLVAGDIVKIFVMRGTDGANTTTPPTVGEIRTEMEGVGTKLTDVLGDTAELQGNQADWATATSVTVSDKTGFALSAAGVDAILDGNIEGTHSLREMMRLFASMLVGKVSGGGTATITFRDIDDTKNRIVMTVTDVGNRTALTLTED